MWMPLMHIIIVEPERPGHTSHLTRSQSDACLNSGSSDAKG
jgi:hypothetical protein